VAETNKPFLRWAGGKNWLIKHLDDFLPRGFNKYVEPFLGGGSVFFYLSPETGVLSDLNQELVETYQVLRDDVESVIKELSKYKNNKEFYYNIRTKDFNSEIKRVSKFIYLNQT